MARNPSPMPMPYRLLAVGLFVLFIGWLVYIMR
jgi:hypothetical protein